MAASALLRCRSDPGASHLRAPAQASLCPSQSAVIGPPPPPRPPGVGGPGRNPGVPPARFPSGSRSAPLTVRPWPVNYSPAAAQASPCASSWGSIFSSPLAFSPSFLSLSATVSPVPFLTHFTCLSLLLGLSLLRSGFSSPTPSFALLRYWSLLTRPPGQAGRASPGGLQVSTELLPRARHLAACWGS